MPPKKTKSNGMLPGMETFIKEEETEFFLDGVKNMTYFDAAQLPDTPRYQASAEGATTYTLYLVFPTRDELIRAITALTKGKRKGLAAGAKLGTLNGVAEMPDGSTLLEMWEEALLGTKRKEKEGDPDEAQAPI